VRGEHDVHVRLHALDGERLAVEDQLVATDLRTTEELAARVHGGLGRALRAFHPRELRLGLGAPAIVEQVLVDLELDAAGPETVCKPDGEVLRDRRTLQPEALDGAQRELRSQLARLDSGLDELVDAEIARA
jgi:hypothetical protein